jgi:hypothetical protein
MKGKSRVLASSVDSKSLTSRVLHLLQKYVSNSLMVKKHKTRFFRKLQTQNFQSVSNQCLSHANTTMTPSRPQTKDLNVVISAMAVWQGVAMDYLKFHLGPPCPTLLRPADGPPLKRPYSRFRGGPPPGRAACGRLLLLWTHHDVRLW